MHELSIANALLDQLESEASERGAVAVASARIRVGLMSGVEPQLLQRAFSIARLARAVTSQTTLEIEKDELLVSCADCGRESIATTGSDLRCSQCEGARTSVCGGDELLLLSIQMDVPDDKI